MTREVALPVDYLPHYAGRGPLVYAHEGDAGFDLVWSPNPPDNRGYVLETLGHLAGGGPVGFETGVRLQVPPGFEVQVRPRSGLALRSGITVVNAPGTIDCGYRGEVVVVLARMGRLGHDISPGTRIAQAVLAPVVRAEFAPWVEDETARGGAGFGSTGRT